MVGADPATPSGDTRQSPDRDLPRHRTGTAPASGGIIGLMGWCQRPKQGIVQRSQTARRPWPKEKPPSMSGEAIGSRRDHREADCTSQPPLMSEDTPGHLGAAGALPDYDSAKLGVYDHHGSPARGSSTTAKPEGR